MPELGHKRVIRSGQRARLAWIAVGFAVTFVLVDRLIATVRLPETVTNTGSPTRMLADYSRLSPPADVAFVGCSYTSFGIDPEVVDAEALRLGVEVHSVNLGFGGALTLTSSRMCELLIGSERPPRVIYYELSPGILNTRLPSLRYGVGQIGGFREAAVLWNVSPPDRADAVLSQTLAGFYQWDDIRSLVECAREGAPLFRPRFRRSARGYLSWMGGGPEREALVARAVADRDSYWGRYAVDDFAFEAVLRVVQLAHTHGVQLRFYEMPVSADWQQVTRDDVNRAYAAALASLQSVGCAAPWRCPTGLLAERDFFDADHLLAPGAVKVSRAIAADVVQVRSQDARAESSD